MLLVKQQIDGLNTPMDVFEGRKPIQHLKFLAVLRVKFDSLCTSEEAAVRLTAYLLSREAKGVHAEPLGLVYSEFEEDWTRASDNRSWENVVHEIMRLFIDGRSFEGGKLCGLAP